MTIPCASAKIDVDNSLSRNGIITGQAACCGPDFVNDSAGKIKQSLGDDDNDDAHKNNKNYDDKGEEYEYVLVVPQKLTMVAKHVLYSKRDITPIHYHLEGRFGSRIHKIDESHMGLPLFTASVPSSSSSSLMVGDQLLQAKTKEAQEKLAKLTFQYDDLRKLLDMDGVSLTCKLYTNPRSHLARPPPYIDARIHPERQPHSESELLQGKKKRGGTESDNSNNTLNEPITIYHEPPLFSYVELFAGMGGFGIALDSLGGRCVFCSELEEHLQKIYHHNFVTLPNNQKKQKLDSSLNNNDCDSGDNDKEETVSPTNNNVDIHIPIHGNIYEVPNNAFPDPSFELDLLVGGFPCQPFSALGQQPGFNCPKSGNLFLEITRFLKMSQPKAFLLENVPGLLGMTETYNIIVKALENVGYDVSTEVVSARGLTATGRKRLFFVGLRRRRRDYSNGKENKFEFPFIPDLQLTFRDILDYDTLPKKELEILRLSESTFNQLLTNKRRWRPSSLAWPNTKGDTLTSHYGNAVGRGESQLVPCSAPNRPRRFSMREMSRMMGFPNTYEFLPIRERQSQMAYRKENYRMIGNAVCPPVIAVLAGAILDHCRPRPKDYRDWVERGREVAIALAISATRSEPAHVPRGCLVRRER